jgi:glutamate/tyrosine decarboxylase-like PLP-dependent enzyme
MVPLFAAFLGLGVDACLQTQGQRKDDLRERAEEILPAGAEMLTIGYGDCVELAPSPSCAQVVFRMRERDSEMRAARLRDEARRQGWTITHSDNAEGGWSVFAEKDGYTVMAVLWRPEVYEVDCGDSPDPGRDENRFCLNTLNIQR